MIKIGLTGGIGSGKSVIALLLQTYEIPIYIADIESKNLVETSDKIRKELIKIFGNKIYVEDKLNRNLMASLVFEDKILLQKVNNLIHPEVAHHFNEWVKKQTSDMVVLESAILFESGFNRYIDKTLLVIAPFELRINRTVIRDKITQDEVLKRIQNQLPDDRKKKLADFIIINDGYHPLIPQIENIITLFISQ